MVSPADGISLKLLLKCPEGSRVLYATLDRYANYIVDFPVFPCIRPEDRIARLRVYLVSGGTSVKKFVTALILAIALVVSAHSVSWGNEASPEGFGGTWESFGEFLGGTWE